MRRARLHLLCLALLFGCTRAAHETPQQVFERTVHDYHLLSAEATGVQRERLLAQAASGYEQVLKMSRSDLRLSAMVLRSLANVRAEQGRLDEAVQLYARVGQQYPTRDWEVLQAWKSAADLLWDTDRHDEATTFYRKIVERFGADASPIIHTIAVAAQRRL